MFSSFYLNPYAAPLLPVGLISLLTGAYIFAQNRRSLTNISFALVCVCVMFWFSGLTLVYSTHDEHLALSFYRIITFLGVTVISPGVYFFSVSWLGMYERKRISVWAGLGGGLLFYIVGLFSNHSFMGVHHYTFGFYPKYGPINAAFLVFFFIYFIAAFYIFISAYFREKNSERKAQIRLISGAFLVCYVGATDYIPKFIYFNFYPLGFATTFFWIIVVAYAIIRYKAMDIETVIHKTLMWMATVSVALAPFIGFVFWTHEKARILSPVIAALVFSVFMLIFYFYLQLVLPRLDNLFQRRRSDLRSELEKFSKELVYLTDLRSLLQRFARLLRRSLYVKEMVIYLFDEKNDQYVPVIAKRIRGFKPIPKDQVFLLWLSKEARVSGLQKLRQNPENETMLSEINSFFEQLHASVMMPLIVGDKLIGFVALGKRMNLRSYKHDEIQFLTQVAVPVSIALSNSMQFEKVHGMTEELQKWNRDLEARVEKRTRELRETQEQLIQAEKMATLGILAGGVAHEINNPLTAVLTNAQILKMSVNADDAESLGMIEEGAKRCQVIVQKLLNYSRTAVTGTSGQKTDLNKAIKNTVAMLAYQIKQENIEIEFQSEELPPVLAVQNEIEQVFTNLIVNARDAIMKSVQMGCLPAGRRGKIQIHTFLKGKKICAEVSDNGCGIPKEIIGKIFDPFFTTKDVGEGTGLGLSVSHGIITRYGGEISVQSEDSKGATFTISFPIA